MEAGQSDVARGSAGTAVPIVWFTPSPPSAVSLAWIACRSQDAPAFDYHDESPPLPVPGMLAADISSRHARAPADGGMVTFTRR